MQNELNQLVGKTLVTATGAQGDEQMILTASDGTIFKFYHPRDCCESVSIEDVAGDLSDLIGSPILQAEESESRQNPEGVKMEYQDDSFTWTFYKFATIKGSVTVRWYGESNGYYSENVDLRVTLPQP